MKLLIWPATRSHTSLSNQQRSEIRSCYLSSRDYDVVLHSLKKLRLFFVIHQFTSLCLLVAQFREIIIIIMVWGRTTKRIDSMEFLTGDDSASELLKQKQAKKHRTCKRVTIWSALTLFLILLIVFLVIWVAVPIAFMLSLPFKTFMVFLPIDSPRNANFDRPEDFGLEGVHNFHIPTRDYYDNNTWTSIGAWLVLPESEINSTASTTNISEILRNTQHDVVIYLHGVLANRAKALEQYRVIRKHFLIIAIDHRGYGDSGANVRMTEDGIANDHVQIYEWVKAIRPENDVYYWGHSLGSGLGTHTLKLLKETKGIVPKGLVLESPFTSLEDVVKNIVLGKIFSWLAYFDATVLRPLVTNGFHFRSRENVLSIDCPIMILHAADDFVVPYFLGELLAMTAAKDRSSHQGSVTFHGISADYGLGHNDIVLHPMIGNFVSDFQAVCRNFSISIGS